MRWIRLFVSAKDSIRRCSGGKWKTWQNSVPLIRGNSKKPSFVQENACSRSRISRGALSLRADSSTPTRINIDVSRVKGLEL
jgi:hypothetical protein